MEGFSGNVYNTEIYIYDIIKSVKGSLYSNSKTSLDL